METRVGAPDCSKDKRRQTRLATTLTGAAVGLFAFLAYLATLSAVWATAAVVLVYLICLRLLGRVIPSAALAFGAGETF